MKCEDGFYPHMQLWKLQFPANIKKAFEDVSIVTTWCGHEIAELGLAMSDCKTRINELEAKMEKVHCAKEEVVVDQKDENKVEKGENMDKAALSNDVMMRSGLPTQCEPAGVSGKKTSKIFQKLKMCKSAGCGRTSETHEIKNDACVDHRIQIRAEKAAKVKRARQNKNEKKRLCLPLTNIGSSTVEKFTKVMAYYRDVVCPAMERSGLHQYEEGLAIDLLKDLGICIVRQGITISDESQKILLEKLFKWKFETRLFTKIGEESPIDEDLPNR